MVRSIIAGLLGVLVSMSPALAQISRAKYLAPHPARVREAAKLKRVAVLGFTGNEADRFAATLLGELRSATYDNQPYFDVVSAEGVVATAPPPPRPAPAGRRKQAGGSRITVLPNSDTGVGKALRIGRAAHVDGVIIGDVTAAIERRNFTEARSGENNTSMQVQCHSATVNFTVIPKMVNVETGQVVYSRTVATGDSFKICGGKVDRGAVGNMIRDLESNFCFLGCKKKERFVQTVERRHQGGKRA